MGKDRIGRSEALYLLSDAPLLVLLEQAREARIARGGGDEAGFCVEGRLYYANECVTACPICGLHRPLGHPEAFTRTPGQLAGAAARARDRGATALVLQGGHTPKLDLDYALACAGAVREAAPGCDLIAFSPAEVRHIAHVEDIPPDRVFRKLHDSGLRLMPDSGVEVLAGLREWAELTREAHAAGLRTTATITCGYRQTPGEIVEQLLCIRDIQDETGGFLAFAPASHKHSGAAYVAAHPSGCHARLVAVARLVLDNVPHIQASNASEGWRAAQLALHAGADDFGEVVVEGAPAHAPESPAALSAAAAAAAIRDAGRIPVERRADYTVARRFEDQA